MTGPADDREEIWLRGNVRPAVLLAGFLVVAALPLLWLGARSNVGPLVRWGAGMAGIAAVILAAAAVAVAAAPRLVRRGAIMRVRLRPLRTWDVPLDAVECFFLGSNPLVSDPAAGPTPRRVGTIVMRIAERAAPWHDRPALASWGTWQGGNVVFDGRWCEPVSMDVARGLSRRLLDAKKQEAAAGGAGA